MSGLRPGSAARGPTPVPSSFVPGSQDQGLPRARAIPPGEILSTPTTPDRTELTMTATQMNTIPSPPEGQDLATVPMRFEVTPIPVTDFDRAKAFYQRLGWRVDIDLQFTEQVRAVQFTPPGSPASIQFGAGGRGAPPAAAADRRRHRGGPHGARRPRHRDQRDLPRAAGRGPAAGRDPQGRSYVSHATFSDPDGNQWVLQEVTSDSRGGCKR